MRAVNIFWMLMSLHFKLLHNNTDVHKHACVTFSSEKTHLSLLENTHSININSSLKPRLCNEAQAIKLGRTFMYLQC